MRYINLRLTYLLIQVQQQRRTVDIYVCWQKTVHDVSTSRLQPSRFSFSVPRSEQSTEPVTQMTHDIGN